MKNVLQFISTVFFLFLIGYGLIHFFEIEIVNLVDWIVGLSTFVWLVAIVVIPWKDSKSDFKKPFLFLLKSKSPNYDLINYFDTIYYNKSSKGIFSYYASNSKINNLLAIKNS